MAKLRQLTSGFSFGLTERLKERGIVSVAAHPGSNLDTNLGSHLVIEDYNEIATATKRNTGKNWTFKKPRCKTFAQIGATPLIAALDPSLSAKAPVFLHNSQVMDTAKYARDPEHVEKLWALSEKLVVQEFKY